MAAALDTSDLTFSVAATWISTGDPEVLKRALTWPDVPAKLVHHIGELTLTEYANEGDLQIKLITLIARAATRQAPDTYGRADLLDRLTARLEELSNEGYTAEYGLVAAAEALHTAYMVGRAPNPDAPLMSTEAPSHGLLADGRNQPPHMIR